MLTGDLGVNLPLIDAIEQYEVIVPERLTKDTSLAPITKYRLEEIRAWEVP